MQDYLGVSQRINRKTGKVQLMWRGKADYALRSIAPQVSAAVQLATPGENSRNQTSKQYFASQALGVKFMNDGPKDPKYNLPRAEVLSRLFKLKEELLAERAEIETLPHMKKDKDGEYPEDKERELIKKRLAAVEQELGRLRRKEGVPNRYLPSAQRKKKPKTEVEQLKEAIKGGESDEMKELRDLMKGGDSDELDELRALAG